MGTNYYWQAPLGEPIHIGKSSIGWCFGVRIHPKLGINDLSDWIKRFNQNFSKIQDEYGLLISPEEMIDCIVNRKWNGPQIGRSEAFFKVNECEPGPNGLLRRKIDGICVGHGGGTWDYLDGNFS